MKPRFTMEQHYEAAELFRRIKTDLYKLGEMIGSSYPRNAVNSDKIFKLEKQLSMLKSDLEEEMFSEGHKEAEVNVYYGPKGKE